MANETRINNQKQQRDTMPTLSLGGQTLATQTGSDAPVLGSVTLDSNQSFPAGMVIKTYQKVFKGTQDISPIVSGASEQISNDVTKWVVVGAGASGSDGDPLNITLDTPKSSSSKYLIRANVTYSRKQDGSNHMGWWYRTAGTSDTYVPLVQGKGGIANYWTQAAFGSSHHSTTGGSGNYGVRQGSMEYLWSPGTSTAYQIQIMIFTYSAGPRINRPYNADAHNYQGSFISTFTIQELAG